MMKRTHISIGLVATIPLIVLNPISFLGLLGNVVPDWDFYLGIKHRTITHSLLFLLLSTIVISLFNISVSLVWFICYGLHLIADSFTKMGTPYLYPFNKKYYGLKRIKTRGAEDYTVQFVMILLICWIYLL